MGEETTIVNKETAMDVLSELKNVKSTVSPALEVHSGVNPTGVLTIVYLSAFEDSAITTIPTAVTK